jgi:hypothetical protein
MLQQRLPERYEPKNTEIFQTKNFDKEFFVDNPNHQKNK